MRKILLVLLAGIITAVGIGYYAGLNADTVGDPVLITTQKVSWTTSAGLVPINVIASPVTSQWYSFNLAPGWGSTGNVAVIGTIGRPVKNHRWQAWITGGNIAASNVQLHGSCDNVNWSTLDSSTTTTFEARQVVNSGACFVKLVWNTHNWTTAGGKLFGNCWSD